MKVEVLYPVVVGLSSPDHADAKPLAFYQKYQRRFTDSWEQMDAGHPHTLRMILCSPNPVGIKEHVGNFWWEHWDVEITTYHGKGWDIGAHIAVGSNLDCDLVVCLVTPTYFPKSGWLAPLVAAFKQHGDGLYGTSASFQNCPHIRTGCFAVSPKTLRDYPYPINSREDTFYFESGVSPTVAMPERSLTNWILAQGKPAKMVTPTGCYDKDNWRQAKNLFRSGDQSNALVCDRHFDIYAEADATEKLVLENLADGKPTQ